MKLFKFAFIALVGLSMALTSCEKSDISANDDTSLSSALNDFLFLATAGDSTTTTGSGKGHGKGGHGKGGLLGGTKHHLTHIAVADLPAAITSYISTNYAGSSIKNAAQDSVKNYIVAVQKADSTHVGVMFDANGVFVKELPKRVKPTSIALTDLPAAITTYVSSTYAGSTIQKAFKDSTTGNYMVLVKKADNTHVGLGFDSAGLFVSELTMQGKGGKRG